MKSLNYNNINKHYLNVTFADEKATTIMVCMPTKSLLSELTETMSTIKANNDLGTMDELFNVCAKTMSRNKTGVVITKAFLEEVFDFEDVLIFFKEYISFVGEVAGRKN